jgi:hypothetical protein
VLVLFSVTVLPAGSVSEMGTPGAMILPSVSANTVPPIFNVGWQVKQS